LRFANRTISGQEMSEHSEHAKFEKQLRRALMLFNDIDPKMQVSTILTLLEVANAQERGAPHSVQDIATKIGMNGSSASRNVHYWANGHKEMAAGKQMVQVDLDDEDKRRRIITLTDRGHSFVSHILDGPRKKQ
jgi:DNA-binding MarR family transcriptional regulator